MNYAEGMNKMKKKHVERDEKVLEEEDNGRKRI